MLIELVGCGLYELWQESRVQNSFRSRPDLLVSRDDGGNALIAFIVRQFSDLNLTWFRLNYSSFTAMLTCASKSTITIKPVNYLFTFFHHKTSVISLCIFACPAVTSRCLRTTSFMMRFVFQCKSVWSLSAGVGDPSFFAQHVTEKLWNQLFITYWCIDTDNFSGKESERRENDQFVCDG